MSFADLESGALPAPRKGRGPDATRALVFQITTAVSSYRRLLNQLGTPKDTPSLRDQLSVLDPLSLLVLLFGLHIPIHHIRTCSEKKTYTSLWIAIFGLYASFSFCFFVHHVIVSLTLLPNSS